MMMMREGNHHKEWRIIIEDGNMINGMTVVEGKKVVVWENNKEDGWKSIEFLDATQWMNKNTILIKRKVIDSHSRKENCKFY